MNTEILQREQPETARSHNVEAVRENPQPMLSPAEARGRRAPSTIATRSIVECDLLVASGLRTPIKLMMRPFGPGWKTVEGKRLREIERELHAKGWNLFYLIPDVQVSAISRHREQAVRKAMDKVFHRAVERGVNTIEIVTLQTESRLGFHRSRVRARLRHIQESPYLFTTNEAMRQRMRRVKAHVRTIRVTRRHHGRDYAEYKPF